MENTKNATQTAERKPLWDEFCEKHLGKPAREVDDVIRQFEELRNRSLPTAA